MEGSGQGFGVTVAMRSVEKRLQTSRKDSQGISIVWSVIPVKTEIVVCNADMASRVSQCSLWSSASTLAYKVFLLCPHLRGFSGQDTQRVAKRKRKVLCFIIETNGSKLLTGGIYHRSGVIK